MTDSLPEETNNELVAMELIGLANAKRVPPPVRKRLAEIATRLQSGSNLEGLVKFADGTYGCHACGARPDKAGELTHLPRFHHD
jgi:hypothetical protein